MQLQPKKTDSVIQPRIINGENAVEGRNPYMVALLFPWNDLLGCGGTMVAPDVVLTAAHCRPFNDTEFVALVNPFTLNNTLAERIAVAEYIPHPNYIPGAADFDAMLLRLARPASTASTIRLNLNSSIPTSENSLSVLGWGLRDENDRQSVSTTLQQTNLNYINNDVCVAITEVNAFTYNGLLTDNMMCAIASGTGVCGGDSGE